jgi:hypothetical protein
MRKIRTELSVWLVTLALGGVALVAGSALAPLYELAYPFLCKFPLFKHLLVPIAMP